MDFPHISGSLGIVHPLCIEQERNAETWDEQGQHYIDFIGGIGVLNLGHGHPAVVEAVKDQVETLMHSAFNALPHRGYLEVVEALDAFVPVDYSLSCMLTNSGAEATENALKVARAATCRQAVIAFDDGFHGRTLAALNLNGKVKPYKNLLGALPEPVFHLPFPSRDSGVGADKAWWPWRGYLRWKCPVTKWRRSSSSRCRARGAFAYSMPSSPPACARSATSTASC